jgi:hypothetical protein
MGYASPARWSRMLIIGLLALIAAVPTSLSAVRSPAAPLAVPVPPPLNPDDENWSADFRYPGINGKVAAIVAAPNGDIYVGGTFSQADDEPAVGVARWDGANWHALGAGIAGNGLNGTCCFDVNALALGPDGSLYVGGRFEKAGGVTVNHIARWDGTTWQALGAGVSRPDSSSEVEVNAIAVDSQGAVYASGRFTMAGEVPVNYIARWDGAAWHALGGGLRSESTALALGPDGSLYASRSFAIADMNDLSASFVARWDGAAWHDLGTGPGKPPFVYVHHLAVDQAGMLYAGGSFLNSATSTPQDIARWDGTSWQSLGSGLEYGVTAMAIGPGGTVYAATGDSRIARWDGAWTQLPGQLNGAASALATTADGTLYAAADFSSLTVRPLRIARWDGAAWNQLSALTGEGLGGPLNDMLAAPDGSIYVAGDFWHAGSVMASGVARWDGAAWHALGSNLHGWVRSLALGPDGALYAGGDLQLAGEDFALQVVRWNGTAWQSLGGAVTDRNVGTITALAVAPDGTVYVGGLLGGMGFTSIGRWNGTVWQDVGGGLGDPDNGLVQDLAIAPDGSLYAAGRFSVVDGAAVDASVARWDGSDWQAIDGATAPWSYVYQLEFHAGSLYAAGETFTMTNPGAGVARWDGAQWQSIPDSGLQGEFKYIFDLAFDQAGNLFIGGLFTQVGAQPAHNIARWDGSQWHAMGSGANGVVRRLVVDASGRLYAGGEFSRAGSTGSGRIARWTAGDGRCGLTPDVPAIFYPSDQPVAVTLRTPGTLACVSIQRVDASYPNAPPELQTGAYWAIHGTDAQGAPASGMTFDLSLPLPAGAGVDDQVCGLGIAWHCAADSISTTAVTRTLLTSFGIWTRAAEPVPGATWDLADLAVDTSALTSSAILTYTLDVGASFGGQYSVTLDLHPGLILLAAPELTVAGRTLSAVGVVSPGVVRPYTITVAIDPAFSGTITQTARISGGAQQRTLSAPPVVIEPAPAPTFRLYLPAIRR